MQLKISELEKEGNTQVAKYLKYPVLCTTEELRKLFSLSQGSQLFPLTGFFEKPFQVESFLEAYQGWEGALESLALPMFRPYLACLWTADENALWLQRVSSGKCLLKMRTPVVQMQAHFFRYSSVDKTAHSMVFSKDSIFWGIQFSYPQIYQEGISKACLKAPKREEWQAIKRWVRDETAPVRLQDQDTVIQTTMRLGKGWKKEHPVLTKLGLKVV